MNVNEPDSDFRTIAQFLSRYDAEVEGRGMHSDSPEALAQAAAWIRGGLPKSQRSQVISKALQDKDYEAVVAKMIIDAGQGTPSQAVEGL